MILLKIRTSQLIPVPEPWWSTPDIGDKAIMVNDFCFYRINQVVPNPLPRRWLVDRFEWELKA